MKYLNLIILLLFLLACQDKKKDEIKHLVSEWQGKEIRFPKDMVFARFATDTVDFTLPKSPHKVLVFVDSIGCTSCKLQLHRFNTPTPLPKERFPSSFSSSPMTRKKYGIY